VQVIDFSRVSGIFRLISRFFNPFLSWKRLVSRGLRQKRGLFESRRVERNKCQQQKQAKNAKKKF